MRHFLISVLLLCSAACSQKAWIDRLASLEEQRAAVETAQQLRDGDVDKLAQIVEPQMEGELQRGVAEVRPILERARSPFIVETVYVFKMSGGPVTKTFNLKAGSGSNWAVVEIVFRGAPGALRLAGFHVSPASSDPSKLNDFSIGRRGVLGYMWLILMFGSAALCLWAVVLIWRRPWLKRRWLWTLGSLFGFAGFGLNWSTGAWGVLPVHFSVLGASATKAGPFSPWVMTFGIPVIAIIVILRWVRGGHQVASA